MTDIVDDVESGTYAAMHMYRAQEIRTDKQLLYDIIYEVGEVDAGSLHSRHEN